MTEPEKILELLDKDSLTFEEKIFLQNAFKSSTDAVKLKETYEQLRKSLQNGNHIDVELLGRYVLSKNTGSLDAVILILSKKIEAHLQSCTECTEILKELNREYSEVENFIGNNISEKITKIKTKETGIPTALRWNTGFKYAIASLTAVIIIYMGLYTYSSAILPDYKTAFLSEEDFYTSRGRSTESFQRGLSSIEDKMYDEAAEYFNDDIAGSPVSESIFYTHYLLGLTYIKRAENDFAGLFKSFDREDVLMGVHSLKKSIELNSSGSFENLNLDAHFYIGRAYMLIDEFNEARGHLSVVVEKKGGHYKEAAGLLDIISQKAR